jgi:hypothetical protein
MAQKDVKPNLVGRFPWSAFKAKSNEKFTPHNQILKDGQKTFKLVPIQWT